jgi:hypothetical protein
MHVTRAVDGVAYAAPGHVGVDSLRLQGGEAGGPERVAVSVSTYPPGAGVEPTPTAADTIYVILGGELELNGHLDTGSLALGVHDSVYLRQGEIRSLRNVTDNDAVLLVVIVSDAGSGV